MTISSVEIYVYDLTYVHGQYVMSRGRVVDRLQSTVARVITKEGVDGFGEVCPLGPAYLPAHARGARAALEELAPALIGVEVSNHSRAQEVLDRALNGHSYAKSALDVARWDAFGKSVELPACELLGGRISESFPLYFAVPLGPAEDMAAYVSARRSEGIHRFQLKLGADPVDDIRRTAEVMSALDKSDIVVADANGGWRLADAVVVARALDRYPNLFLEQPCPTLEECLIVRERTTLPMILDESIQDVASLLRAYSAKALEGFNLKISKVGGLTYAKAMRDLGQTLGLSMTIEDSWGGDLVTAAVAHLAASTSVESLFTVSFMNDWTNEHVAGYEPRSEAGRGSAPAGHGLGVDVDLSALGKPVVQISSREQPSG
ncbi:MAG TPA: mandelate racemase/muconate lactonizing enzyme family protein [Gaiellaceae bacterium]|nr:mandelate racemase/muconate lactonizing enzyme family protein [Gaiellaceae bacterium]